MPVIVDSPKQERTNAEVLIGPRELHVVIFPPSSAKSRKDQQSQTNSSITSESLESNVFQSLHLSEAECNKDKWTDIRRNLKVATMVLIWVICFVALLINNVQVQQMHQISIPKEQAKTHVIMEEPTDEKLYVKLQGALVPAYYSNLSTNWLSVWIELLVLKRKPKGRKIRPSNIELTQNISEVWHVPLVGEKLLEFVPEVRYEKVFDLKTIKVGNANHSLLRMNFATNMQTNFPVSMGYNLRPIDTSYGIIYAALVLLGLYLLIIFELVHRTLAAMLASTMSVAILAAMEARPTMAEIISWIDIETLILLFSMMTLVTILSETGIFDYMSFLAFKFTGGKIWPLISTLCAITGICSSFVDNVTTTLLITPVTIRLCEAMKLNPVPVLTYMLIFANIGGVITPIGDPPNVIIASNADVVHSGVTFGIFTLHMSLGAALAFIIVYFQLRYTHRSMDLFLFKERNGVPQLKHEIGVWQRVAASLSSYSRDEETVRQSLLKKSSSLIGKLQSKVSDTTPEKVLEEKTPFEDLKNQYPIKDKVLLVKSGITLLLVICVFFLHSIPELNKLGLGWTALLGALLLLILYDKDNIEGIFARVEWSTLLFFASLFILMEALAKLGLIQWVGLQTQGVILSVGERFRLTVAIILILWVSGIASAFVDNLPLTTMMVRIATNLAENPELGLPLQPLVWALSFGACLGGNGTLFGSSSNIICAGIAEQHGYKFSFTRFTRIGLPVMVTSMMGITVYLVICHVIFTWH